MPSFPKIRFKSKAQYNVASKSVYVLTVELLDNTLLECTLTAESSGRDCMDNVCQRLGLAQGHLMGLRYVTSRTSYPKIRWVDLDRPLKKQLDKYAAEPYLYLGVMFYVNDVSLLEDEVTRYHFFLQLKLDVVEGRLRCNYEQAIVLASYSLQAEFGDHDPEKHTSEYLQDFPLLPKPMVNERITATLTEAIITQHASLRGIAQQLAEVYYIVGAQQLDGYGQECFLAKDDTGNEVLIGASLTGIVVRKGNGASPAFFRWNDITNLVNHKRFFGIECQNYEYSAQFVLDEAESAKYVWKMCVLQHSFFKQNTSSLSGDAESSNELNITLENQGGVLNYHDSVLPPVSSIQPSEIANFTQQTQQITPHHAMKSLKSNSSAASSSTKLHQTLITQQLANSSLNLTTTNDISAGAAVSVLSGARSTNDLDQLHIQQATIMTPNGPTSAAAQQQLIITPEGTGPIPYRPVPDYETAVQNKMYLAAAQKQQQQQQVTQLNPSQSTNLISPLYNNTHQIYTSHPTLIMDNLPQNQLNHAQQFRQHQQQQQQHQQQQQQHSYYIQQLQQQQQMHHQQIILDDSHHQQFILQQQQYSSTPELNQQHQQINLDNSASTQEQIVAELQRLNLYKPPPPYPYNNNNSRVLNSNSTPDLASGIVYQVPGHVGGSSPDLVSRRYLGVVHPANNATADVHRTYDNLAGAAVAVVNTSANDNDSYYYNSNNNNSSSNNINVNNSNTNVNENTEPIYQNQQQIKAAELGNSSTTTNEPIYQNLPIPSQINNNNNNVLLVNSAELIDDSAVIKDSVEDRVVVHPVHSEESDQEIHIDNTVSSGPAHISRIAITNSREDLHTSVIADSSEPNQQQPPTISNSSSSGIVENDQSINKPNNSFYFNESSSIMNDSSFLNHSNHNNNNHINMNKPRAGRKRWGLNFGNKSGSLKSIKSESGGSSNLKDDSKIGPMMLAALHGLTRSRPDLLSSESSSSSLYTFSSPARMPKDEIGAYLESKLAEGEVLREFEQIPKKKAVKSHFTVSTLGENLSRNRFEHVLPYDENRVKIPPSKENKHGYVNASHISATVGQSQRFYIASQGPLPNTVYHFWQLIYHSDVHLVVMLTESSGVRGGTGGACIPYWPINNGSVLELGDFQIVKKFTSENAGGSYTTSTLEVKHVPSKTTRKIWHLQYTDWSDHGCPSDVGKYLEFMEELAALRRHTAGEMGSGSRRQVLNKNPPVLVHCSAGVGRSGVTILSDILLYCVDHNIDIDIPKVLTHLRQQRMLMVQTIAQYKFVHTVLIHYLKKSRLI